MYENLHQQVQNHYGNFIILNEVRNETFVMHVVYVNVYLRTTQYAVSVTVLEIHLQIEPKTFYISKCSTVNGAYRIQFRWNVCFHRSWLECILCWRWLNKVALILKSSFTICVSGPKGVTG